MKIEQIKENSLIKLDISTYFFQRLQGLTLYMTQLKTSEKLKEIYEKIKTEKELDDYESGLETLFILVNTIEENARKQELIEQVELPASA